MNFLLNSPIGFSLTFHCFQRCIADTTLKKTFMGMRSQDTISKAVFDTTRSLSYEAIHLSMMPVVHERLLAR